MTQQDVAQLSVDDGDLLGPILLAAVFLWYFDISGGEESVGSACALFTQPSEWQQCVSAETATISSITTAPYQTI